MLHSIQSTCRRFRRDQKGSLSVEAVIILPLLFWAITATFTFFHTYKAQSAAFRANYTVSDILSRETGEIDSDYMRGLHNLYQYMTFAKTAGTWLRVSVFHCTDNCDQSDRTLSLLWSEGTNGARDLDASDYAHWDPLVPWMVKGDSVILVETSNHYDPPFANFLMSFPERELVSHSVTRPRFAPQLLWEGMNAGDDDKHQHDKKKHRWRHGSP